MSPRRLSWGLLVVVVTSALLIAATGDRSPRTDAERARSIASGVRCPTCRGLSAAESDAKAAQAVREEIRDRVRAGESDAEIRAFLVSRYGEDILLRPRATGVAALVWMLPVAALVVAAALLASAFVRWRAAARRRGQPSLSDADRALVEDSLRP